MRRLVYVLLWLVFLAACFLEIVFVGVSLFGEDGETRLGGLIFTAGGGLVVFGLWKLLQRVRPPRRPRTIEQLSPVPEMSEEEIVVKGSTGEIRLNREGFVARVRRVRFLWRGPAERVVRHRWDEIAEIKYWEYVLAPPGGPIPKSGVPMVAFTRAREPKRGTERFGRWLLGVDESVPGLYGDEQRTQQVVELMQRYRDRYGPMQGVAGLPG